MLITGICWRIQIISKFLCHKCSDTHSTSPKVHKKCPENSCSFSLHYLSSFSKTMKSCTTSSYPGSISIWSYWCSGGVTQPDVEDIYRYNQFDKHCSLKNYEKQPVKFILLTVIVVYRDCIWSGSKYLIKKQEILFFFKGHSSHLVHVFLHNVFPLSSGYQKLHS